MQSTLVQHARPLRGRVDAAIPLARGELAVLAALVAVAAALRFPTLSDQSFWHDEAVTVGRVLRPSLGDTLSLTASSEATPPAYYVLAWLWTRVFGVSEFGIRSLSAVCGVALVPTMYAAGRRLWPRAGTMLAALVAVSPFLVWYSQEARAYELAALLSGLSLLCLQRALEEPAGRRLAAWVAVASLALATHYFTAFLVVPEAVWLLAATRGLRAPKLAAIATGAAGAALVPLAIHQSHLHHDTWIARIPPGTRIVNTAKAFVAGPSGAPSALLWVVGGAALAAGLLLLVTRADEGERRRVSAPAALGGAALLVPALLMAVGIDFFYPRNLIPALVVLLLVPAAGFAVARANRAGLLAAFVLCVVNVAAVVAVSSDVKLQRADWRRAAAAIGSTGTDRAVIVPFIGDDPIAYYLPRTRRATGPATVSEVDVLGFAQAGRARRRPPVPGFREFDRRRFGQFTLTRFRGPPHTVRRADLRRASLGTGHVALLVQGAGR
jgi:mannosyltransferase